MSSIKEQIKLMLPEQWELLNVIKLAYEEKDFGSHEMVLYNSNLDLQSRFYFTVRNGMVCKLSKMRELLKKTTEGKLNDFVEAL